MSDSYPGIPSLLTLEYVRQWVQPRVSSKRFKHIEGVVACAGQLCDAAATPVYPAQLAAWLHDSCKEMKSSELLLQAETRGLSVQSAERENPHLLHGPVAALVVRDELNLHNQLVLDAISQHTLGAAPMSILSQIVFLADCLEPGRPDNYTSAIWQALNIENEIDLDAATLVACNISLQHLLDQGKAIHPKTVEVRDHYQQLCRSRRLEQL